MVELPIEIVPAFVNLSFRLDLADVLVVDTVYIVTSCE